MYVGGGAKDCGYICRLHKMSNLGDASVTQRASYEHHARRVICAVSN